MPAFLTTKDVQQLIRVDKSTVYRMAEDGRLPAVKIGRQWRFPRAQIEAWLSSRQVSDSLPRDSVAGSRVVGDLQSVLPAESIENLAELLGDLFGAMVIITEIDGTPLTGVSNPCGLFDAVSAAPGTLPACIRAWEEYGADLDLEPKFRPSNLGFLCARGFIRLGSELRGMVIVGGIAPDVWPPSRDEIERIASGIGMSAHALEPHIDDVFHLNADQQDRIIRFLPRVGTLIAHLAKDHSQLVGKLETIASLVGTDHRNQP